MHSHESEQMTHILQGALKFFVGGEEIIVREGEVLHIPSWVEHGGRGAGRHVRARRLQPDPPGLARPHGQLLPSQMSGNRFALVAAGSRGIGRAAAAALGRDGCRVAICGRDRTALDAAAREIATETGAETALAADVSRQADVERFVESAASHFGGLDILVTNSGGSPLGGL